MKLMITRHAQTRNNEEGRTHDEKLPTEITEEGFLQIKRLIGRLKKEKISRMICSDLDRCRMTAKEIMLEIHSDIEYTPLIREKENGDFGGMKHKDINWDGLKGDFETRKAPNGESLIEVRERARKFFSELLEKHGDSDETILMISHGAFLKVFIGDLLGMNLHDSIFKLFVEHCSLSEIEINPKYKAGYQMRFLNEKDFLN